VKKLTLNLKKCEVSFVSADSHEAKWRPVVEVEGTILRFNPTPLFLGVSLGRTLLGMEQAERKAANLTKGSRVLTALSGTVWGWNGNLLNGATYAGGGWLAWLSATSVDMLNWAQ
jgi:hypothetical protein